MDEAEALYRVDMEKKDFSPLLPVSARDNDLKEKDIEKWVVNRPKILFSDPDSVMIIASEVSGELQADVLAVDSQGNLIVIEIKRHMADRNAVGQILDYAARFSTWSEKQFNQRWKSQVGEGRGDLFDEFRRFVDNSSFAREDFLKNRRLYILAAGEDDSMKCIISWLRDGYGVPIDFVPFGLYKDGDETFLKMGKIDVTPIVSKAEWGFDWFFNTNETYAPNAYEKMIADNVIAACGYGPEKTEHKMGLPDKGQRVFMFVNGKGIIAVGTVVGDSAVQRDTVFGNKDGDEYHREVEWLYRVDPSRAVTSSKCSRDWHYNLPVRCTIAKISNSQVADNIEKALREQNT